MTDIKPRARQKPLCEIDLGSNGNRFAPTTLDEAERWIAKETAAWGWLSQIPQQNHDHSVRAALSLLNDAAYQVQQARGYGDSQPEHVSNQLQTACARLVEVYQQLRLPHTSTPTFKRIEAVRAQWGPSVASLFAYVHVPSPSGYQPNLSSIEAWQGLYLGLQDRFGSQGPNQSRLEAIEQAFEEARARSENIAQTKRAELEALHRDWEEFVVGATNRSAADRSAFDEAQLGRARDFQTVQRTHTDAMDAIRRSFKQEMTLRAPVGYWEAKHQEHEIASRRWGLGTAAMMVFCCLGLATTIYEFLWRSGGSTPATWQVAVLALLGLFGVWATRLVVRVWLSHVHLATDAAERVVMVKTYLALGADGMPSADADRQHLLQALFRPASDGIVKDEGIPPSFLEVLTRQQRN
jgi:hypothetical protein